MCVRAISALASTTVDESNRAKDLGNEERRVMRQQDRMPLLAKMSLS